VRRPPPRAGTVRVVCISDTHNEHARLELPAGSAACGDVLIHAGDIFTEAGVRHVDRARDGTVNSISQEGMALFEHFARWFAALDYHKCMIGGNHGAQHPIALSKSSSS